MTVVYVWVMVAFAGFMNDYNSVYKIGGPDAPYFAVEADCVKHVPRVQAAFAKRGVAVDCVKTPLVVPVFPTNQGAQAK